MTGPPGQEPGDGGAAAELARIRRRESWFRSKTVQDHLVLDTRLRAQSRRIDALSAELGERNTYIHSLHGERDAWVRREQSAFGDLEVFIRRLEAAQAEAQRLALELKGVRGSWGWNLCAPLRRLQRRLAPQKPDASAFPAFEPAPGAAFTYYLHTSPYRLFRGPSFTVRGWAWPADGRAVTAVRVRIDGREFIGRHGIDEPDVIAHHGAQPANPKPGFEVTFETPPGAHRLAVEAQLANTEWRSILTAPIWCEPA